MNIVFDEVGNVKISYSRLMELQKEFDKTYKNIARGIFFNMSEDLKYVLLNDEFRYDKQIVVIIGHHHSHVSKTLEKKEAYLYTPAYVNLGATPNDQTHIRHNAYRTISAMLLDASFEEKVVVLSKSISKLHYKNKDLLNVASFRLNSLIEHLQNNEANINL